MPTETVSDGSSGSAVAETFRVVAWGTARELAFTLALLVAAAAGVALIVPVDTTSSYANDEGGEPTGLPLHCGSVVMPEGGWKSTVDHEACTDARTQRLGYAGLGLAGAVAIATFTVMVPSRQKRDEES
ncbi:hypothetical protein ABZ746_08130 [Streptomyces sp. NPDC020096]